jgi:hypothetical protein
MFVCLYSSVSSEEDNKDDTCCYETKWLNNLIIIIIIITYIVPFIEILSITPIGLNFLSVKQVLNSHRNIRRYVGSRCKTFLGAFLFLSTSFNYPAHISNSVLWDLDVLHLWQEYSFWHTFQWMFCFSDGRCLWNSMENILFRLFVLHPFYSFLYSVHTLFHVLLSPLKQRMKPKTRDIQTHSHEPVNEIWIPRIIKWTCWCKWGAV